MNTPLMAVAIFAAAMPAAAPPEKAPQEQKGAIELAAEQMYTESVKRTDDLFRKMDEITRKLNAVTEKGPEVFTDEQRAQMGKIWDDGAASSLITRLYAESERRQRLQTIADLAVIERVNFEEAVAVDAAAQHGEVRLAEEGAAVDKRVKVRLGEWFTFWSQAMDAVAEAHQCHVAVTFPLEGIVDLLRSRSGLPSESSDYKFLFYPVDGKMGKPYGVLYARVAAEAARGDKTAKEVQAFLDGEWKKRISPNPTP